MNKKLLLINSVCGIGSTGRICADIAKQYEQDGYEVKIAYGRSDEIDKGTEKYAVRIGTKADVYAHVAYTRLFDKHGLASKSATKKFIDWAEGYDPDILWLHNIHGYYINYEMLFDWIKTHQKEQAELGKPVMEVKWTLHDCWAFTGHCSHFTFVGCEKWKDRCNDCPQKKEYPAGLLSDNSADNYDRKRKAFRGVRNLTIITPSGWLERLVKESFLGEYPTEVRYNTVDKTVFKPTPSDFRLKHGIRDDQKMILGVSSVWNDRKGLSDFVTLFNKLSETGSKKYKIVLVGLTEAQIKDMPNEMICIPKTSSREDLAKIYTAADVFVNPTYEDTFPTVNLEAESCGTKVFTYDTGGCGETIFLTDSVVVPVGNIFEIVSLLQ